MNREIPCRECLSANVKCEYQDLNNTVRKKTRTQEPPKNERSLMETTIQKVYQKNNLSNRRLTDNTKNETNMHSIPKLNIYEKYSSINVRESTQMNYGPITWISLMKSDPILSSLEQYVLSNIFDLQEVKSKSFLEKDQNEQLPKNLKNIIHLDKESHTDKTFITNIENCSSTEFVRELSNALPLYEMTWNLINIFFTSVYPLLPIIDEFQFKNNVERILKREEEIDSTKWKINIEKNTGMLSSLFSLYRYCGYAFP